MNTKIVALYIYDRAAVQSLGYTTDDLTAFLSLFACWIGTGGIPDVSYGNARESELKFPIFKDATEVRIAIPEDLPEGIETMIASMVMTQDQGAFGPFALQNLDPKIMKPTLAAWRLRNDYHHKQMERVARALGEAVREARGGHG